MNPVNPANPVTTMTSGNGLNIIMNMNQRHQSTTRATLAGLAACIALGGCAAPSAPPRTRSDTTTTSAFEGQWQTSLDRGFDRSDWRPIRFDVPMASVPCNPTYATPVVRDHGGVGRLNQTGAFPTIDTAMSTETDRGSVRCSALADPFVAAFDLVAAPFRMFGTPPDSTVIEPYGDWILLPGADVRPEADDDDGEIAKIEVTAETEAVGDPSPTTPDDVGGWTIRPVFDRPAEAETAPETTE